MHASQPSAPDVGALLRQWRLARRMSQLDLAAQAEVSARHVSFVENGRAAPSREMVLVLANALDVPLRERNALLLAAGFAPAYTETPLDAPAMRDVVAALTLILGRNDPLGGCVFDGDYDLLMVSVGYARMLEATGGPSLPPLTLLPPPRANVLDNLLVGPLRAHIANWDEVAGLVLARAERELARQPDPVRKARLDRLRAAAGLGRLPPADATALLVPVRLAALGVELSFVSTISTLGTAHDLTLQELRIETFHAADAATDATVRVMAAGW